MYKTQNSTTTQVGACSATIVAATRSPKGKDVFTLELVYPRCIHAEVLRHRVFSSSVSSSRATPVSTLIEDSTFIPDHLFENKRGMVGGEPLPGYVVDRAKALINDLRREAIRTASALSAIGLHKQHVNRYLEPFGYVRHLVTATEWDNFFELRLAPDADPIIQDLAKAMTAAMTLAFETKMIKCDTVHLPYITDEELEEYGQSTYGTLPKVSAARCARVSYLKHDGGKSSVEEDVALFDRLVKDKHWSPLEHVCFTSPMVDPSAPYYNLRGWRSLRWAMQEAGFNP